MYSRLLYILCYWFIFLIPIVGISQTSDWEVRWIRPNPDQIFQEAILSLAQDSSGFIWFGTENELVRFDGYDYKIFHFKGNHSKSVQFSMYTALLVDQQGYIWIGSNQDGLSRYDPVHETFEFFRKDGPSDQQIQSNIINSIYQSGDGIVWVGTDQGLHKIESLSGGKWIISEYVHNANDLATISHNHVTSISEDEAGNIWVGTIDGLNILNQNSQAFKRIYSDPTQTGSLSSNEINYLYLDKQNQLWVGTKNGLNQWKATSQFFHSYFHNPYDTTSLSHNDITAIQSDRKGNLWISTKGGLNQFYQEKGRFSRFYAGKEGKGLQNNLLT